MDYLQALEANKFQVNELLRRHHIMNKGQAGVQEGFNKFGADFVMKVVDILSKNTTTSAFSRNRKPQWSSWDATDTGPATYGDYTANLTQDQIAANISATTEKGGFWSFADQALALVNNTGNAIGNFKDAAAGSGANTVVLPASKSGNTMLYIAGAIVLVILGIVIFKSNK